MIKTLRKRFIRIAMLRLLRLCCYWRFALSSMPQIIFRWITA